MLAGPAIPGGAFRLPAAGPTQRTLLRWMKPGRTGRVDLSGGLKRGLQVLQAAEEFRCLVLCARGDHRMGATSPVRQTRQWPSRQSEIPIFPHHARKGREADEPEQFARRTRRRSPRRFRRPCSRSAPLSFRRGVGSGSSDGAGSTGRRRWPISCSMVFYR